MGERDVRNVEVRGSIPLGSTNCAAETQMFSTSLETHECAKQPKGFAHMEVKS